MHKRIFISDTNELAASYKEIMKSELKKVILITLFIIIILNVIGVYMVNVMSIGFFILIAIYSIIAIKLTSLKETALFAAVIAVFSEFTKLTINYFFNYTTLSTNGNVIPLWVTFLAGIATVILSVIVSVAFAGGRILIDKK